ncbi:tRNA (N6-isopentenyl adenosine(37)-C2)-methylthiotransferase MiaB [Candidatus Peregrinibacteria bacterium]|nr:tRNA (N6-isopentenyl adenosine(37)-C2)-methylthiotransferase MiaB [Candidatus Peregrinibacteria bacterium]
MPRYLIETYGCQMNYSDTERMETYLENLGYSKTDSTKEADLIIFNTCSVRQKAEDRVLGRMKEMRSLKKNNPNLIITITGCMVRESSSRYSEKRDKLLNRVREIDICLRIEDLPQFAELIRELNPDDYTKIEEESLKDYFRIPATYSQTTKTQAFLPISTGCDKFCTYCIVPYSRGREHSRLITEIFKEAKELTEKGYKEITLIGQTVNSYGLSVYDKINKKFEDLPENKEPFVYLLEELDKLKEEGLERLRFTSPHPKDMSDDLINAIANLKTLMPYLHLPVQAGDDNTLKRMNRPYTVAQYKEIIKKLRTAVPDIAISTDIIVGFCGETEEEFENTYSLFEEIKFDHAYLAQYSNRIGTFASKKLPDDIPPKIKRERWHKLNSLLKKTSKCILKNYVGKTVKVLIETKTDDVCIGRCEHYKSVQFSSKKHKPGDIVPVKIIDSKEWILIGELVIQAQP